MSMQLIYLTSGCILLFGLLTMTSGKVLAEEQTNVGNNVFERPAYLDPEHKKQMALANSLKAHETVWLDVSYPDVSESIKVLAITNPSLIAEKQGAILFLHDKEQHADWPEIIHPLRKSLPKAGWFTLSVSLPDETRVALPSRELDPKAFDQLIISESLKKNLDSGVRNRQDPESSLNENQSSTGEADTETVPVEQSSEDSESVDIDLAVANNEPDLNKIPYDVRVLKHIEKAYEYLQSQSFQNIVIIAYRHSAEQVLQYVKAHSGEISSPGLALIFIEPVIPEAYLIDISEWLGKDFPVPILDIINKNNQQAGQDAEVRRLSLLRSGAKEYKQLHITITNNEIFDESLSKRIKLWLDTNAPGMKIGP